LELLTRSHVTHGNPSNKQKKSNILPRKAWERGTNGFKKKDQKVPKSEITLAQQRKNEYLSRGD